MRLVKRKALKKNSPFSIYYITCFLSFLDKYKIPLFGVTWYTYAQHSEQDWEVRI